MAEVTVFVDDAVQGQLPYVSAMTGRPAEGLFRISSEVGRSNRLGILWLLVLAGPLGWLIIAVLAFRDSGEHLTVKLPFTEEAADQHRAAQRLRNRSLFAVVAGVGVLAFVTMGVAPMGRSAIVVFGAVSVGVALASAIVGSWKMNATIRE